MTVQFSNYRQERISCRFLAGRFSRDNTDCSQWPAISVHRTQKRRWLSSGHWCM